MPSARRFRAGVVPARGLGDFAMQMLVAEVAVHLDVGALEKGPESLYPVRVRHASHVYSNAVLHALMWSVQAVKGRCLVVEDNCSRFRPRMHGVCQRARLGATYRLGRHLVRLTVSDAYFSLVPVMGWTVDIVFRDLERRFVIHSVITDCVYDDKK